MPKQRDRVTFREALCRGFNGLAPDAKEVPSELLSELADLCERLEGIERLKAFIARVERYAMEIEGLSVDDDFADVDSGKVANIGAIIRDMVWQNLSLFISDEHRRFVVRCHARGIRTTEAVRELMREDDVMFVLTDHQMLGVEMLREELVRRMSYLKPGTARWPEKKYGVVWREARDSYKQMVRELPLTSPGEQVAVLVQHVNRINYELENNCYSVKDLQILTDSLMKTLEGLRKVTIVEERTSANLSGPQLVAVLERLTLALDAPEQFAIGGDTDALVSVLERLARGLKASGQKALVDGGEELVEDVKVVSEEGERDGGESA